MNTHKQISARAGGCFYFRSLVIERKGKEVIGLHNYNKHLSIK